MDKESHPFGQQLYMRSKSWHTAQSNDGGLQRRTTLSRPERRPSGLTLRRAMMRAPDEAPPAARRGATTHRIALPQPGVADLDFTPRIHPSQRAWSIFANIVTICFFPACLRCLGKRDVYVQQAWREKVALVFLVFLTSSLVGFLTFGLKTVMCPENAETTPKPYFIYSAFQNSINAGLPANLTRDYLGPGVIVSGYVYNYQDIYNDVGYYSSGTVNITGDWDDQDLTKYFTSFNWVSQCTTRSYFQKYFPYDPNTLCNVPNPRNPTSPPLPATKTAPCGQMNWLQYTRKTRITFTWPEIQASPDPRTFDFAAFNRTRLPKQNVNMLLGFNGVVVNMTSYFMNPVFRGSSLGFIDDLFANYVGKDATHAFYYNTHTELLPALYCIMSNNVVGFSDTSSVGCFVSQGILLFVSGLTLTVVGVRFTMAVVFYWVLSGRLTRAPPRVTGGDNGSIPMQRVSKSQKFLDGSDDKYTVMMVTCYSEGDASIRTTCDSLINTTYDDQKKLLFVICDGLVTGKGNGKSTPEIAVGLLQLSPELPPPVPLTYLAIANGSKQHNMAQVYAGHYSTGSHRVPAIVVVKCGPISEQSQPKPGNRGKRDSQLLFMNFFSRVMFDDRMTPLDYEIFYRIRHVTGGITADKYELVLMVDADTTVAPDCMTHMVNAMKNDIRIMGLCGETRITNKAASWVSAIQVFEYYISHHLGKAFESVFGSVTCLPGCFSMYRIKVQKGSGNWLPILVNPDIVEEYSENVVDTLHKKNLLLLGEDRFLTTLMLRNFPRRRLMFIPQAICNTVVPDSFSVLLSQRRRWINSTVHNLMELVLVRDLCGILCFSMQFIVGIDLFGTAVLPASFCFMIYLVVRIILSGRDAANTPGATVDYSPLIVLFAVIILPGILILVTTRQIVFIAWMIVYLLALPIWTVILPLYSFWHFDDFSWGATRKVQGETKDDHSKAEGEFDSSHLILKTWTEWEVERQAMRFPPGSNGGGSASSFPASSGSFPAPPPQAQISNPPVFNNSNIIQEPTRYVVRTPSANSILTDSPRAPMITSFRQ
ncbi:chitin synthase [Polychytrium aggregatum]|uniref:chitin synthase n=1 Tax=Polychytrium aggregatum TaxID=110093 RepID=UPI0022FEB316|nr:chitin synthase [Polychytrium aggregatum]KAI9206735.1 chitin synthase [Polychytrium aggregatum]